MKRAKILLLTLAVLTMLIAGGCAKPSISESAAPSPTEPSTPPTTEAVLQSEEPTVSASADICVRVDYATDALLGQYASYDEFDESEDLDYQVKVLFTTSTPVRDFKFLAGGYVEGENDSFSFVADSVLYAADTVSPDKPLVVGTVFHGDFPTRGISFVDENNTTRTFALGMSGKDGSLVLIEF